MRIAVTVFFVFCASVVFSQTTDTVFNRLDSRNLKQGFWQKKYSNGTLAYRAYFVNDRPLGLLVRYHENGKKMAVVDYFDDGTAFGQLYSTTGELVAEGKYIGENKKQGLWKYYRGGKLVMEENYEQGKLHGLLQVYYPSGKVYERKRFKNGLQDGVYEQIDERGVLVFEMLYKSGERNGSVRYYYDNGQIRIEGKYVNSIRVGEWIFYDTNGKVERKTTYTNGIASDKDEVDKRNSDYLKSLESQKGEYSEPLQMFDE